MKVLKDKNEFDYSQPKPELLDTFPNPGVYEVKLLNSEFTSLCPVTNQPDYAKISITYYPNSTCLESKSLKLYLAGYRNYGAFAETLAVKISKDLANVLKCEVYTEVTFQSRGGVIITATASSKSEVTNA